MRKAPQTTMVDWSNFHEIDPFLSTIQMPSRCDSWEGKSGAFAEAVKDVVGPLTFAVEAGTWHGHSAFQICDAVKKIKGDKNWDSFSLLCVDTWLGSLEFWDDLEDETRYKALLCMNGYPTVYNQFISNVCDRGLQGNIIPFPNTSAIAARLLLKKKLFPNLVFLDGSHEYEDVLLDLHLYWPIVRPGGVLLGDDFSSSWPGVQQAVTEFGITLSLTPDIDGHKFKFRKPIESTEGA